jgi:thioredoxin-related protein
MNKLIISALILGISLTSYSQSKKGNGQAMPAEASSVQKETPAAGKLQWTNMTDALARSGKTRKKIIVDFYTDWCGWCKVMDQKTYTDPKVIELINKYFIPVKFNAEKEGPIKYKGQDYAVLTQGMRGTHTLAAALLEGQMGYPTTSFLNMDHSKIQNIPGYIEAGEMKMILKFFGENKYLTQGFDDFKRTEASKPQ